LYDNLYLYSIEEWSKKWQLKFNPDKCKVMRIGHKYNTSYEMLDNGVTKLLEEVIEEKDLGCLLRLV